MNLVTNSIIYWHVSILNQKENDIVKAIIILSKYYKIWSGDELEKDYRA